MQICSYIRKLNICICLLFMQMNYWQWMFGMYSQFGLFSNCLYNKNGTIPYFMILISNRVNSAVRCQGWELMINEFHWVRKAFSQKWKPGGNLGTWHQYLSRSFHFGETPLWFPLGFRTWKHSTRRFLVLETWGKPHSFHTWKQPTREFHLVSLHWKFRENLTEGSKISTQINSQLKDSF